MGKKKSNNEVAVETIMNKYGGYFDYDAINHTLSLINQDDKDKIPDLSKQIVKNIAEWSLNGDDKQEIAKKLEMTPKQFETLCSLCPVLVMVMQQGKELANIIITGSLYQTAIGGQIIRRQQIMKIRDYDDEGKVIGEHIEKVWVEEELPPNALLLKFIAEKKFSEKFGNEKTDQDKLINDTINNMTPEELKKFEESLNGQN